MVVDVALYTVVHQPRRLKLPAQPIPRCASVEDITRCLFDERLNEQYFRRVVQSCYYPAARMFLELVRHQNLRLAIGFSLSFVRQAALWEPALLDLFRELVAEEHVELVGVEPYHSLHCLIDLPAFVLRMRWMADELEKVFGKRPTVTDTTEMCMSNSIYDALDMAGFRGAFLDSDPRVMQWRSSNYLYRSKDEAFCVAGAKLPARGRRGGARGSERDRQGPPYLAETEYENGPYLLARHPQLSADIGVRFSNSTWASYPLYADAYAYWIAQTGGDFALLSWDFETFGEHHNASSGIFDFMRALPGELTRHGITSHTPGELIDRYAEGQTYHLPLPIHPTTWTSSTDPEVYFDCEPQNTLFRLMHDVYNLARLTENPELLDLAIWLTQSDNLRLLQWPGPHFGPFAVPHEWWSLGAAGLFREQKQVYLNALAAFAPYLPARIARQARRKAVARSPRRQNMQLSQDQAIGTLARHI